MGILEKLLTRFLGKKSDRDIAELQPILEQIKAKGNELTSLSNDELRALSNNLKKIISDSIEAKNAEINSYKEKIEADLIPIEDRDKVYETIDKIEKDIDEIIKVKLDEILPTAFAIVKETGRRFAENETLEVSASEMDKELATKFKNIEINGEKAYYHNHWIAGGNEIKWDMIHYDVQLIGGTILHQGKIAEMATGEGKTLVATLPIFLNALSGRGVHVVTVNDYLAKRDSEWMAPLFYFHGLSVDCIDKHQPNSMDRRNAYLADITYGTNNEFGFDYLRDNMARHPEELVQRKHNYAIVDEVDSVLIDDARTPLIISGPTHQAGDALFDEYNPMVEKLYNAQKAFVTKLLADAKRLLASQDKKEIEEGSILLLRCYKGLPKNKPLIKFLSEQGIKSLLTKTENFYMQENNKNMHIITDELFFVIDEKNNMIDLTEKGIDFLSNDTNDRNFFVLPDIGEELATIEKSDIGKEEKIAKKEELTQMYATKSERVHTMNQLLKAYALFEKDVEYVVMDNKIKIVDEQTGRIMEGRRYSDGLHQAIEAKEHVKVESASQTMATITLQNYFRMYKKLAGMTGTAETEAKEFWDIYKLDVVVAPTNRPIQRQDQDDLVYKTRREKYNAVIDKIEELKNQGRPVLVGTTSVEVSELLSRMLTRKNIRHNVLNAKLHQKEAEIVAEAGKAQTVTIATNMAGRGTDIKLSEEVKAAGGLAIIGTERHDSRRVDRQLRGRAGRQGDPGSSQFFVSLEDNLMRMFGSDRIARIMDRMGLEEGEVIQHPMISKSIERAQKKVEENNFGIRKRLLEYDDVMNSQREVIYTRRRHALYGERLFADFSNMLYDCCANVVDTYIATGDFEEFKFNVLLTFSMECEISEKDFMSGNNDLVTEKLYIQALNTYKQRSEGLANLIYPGVKQIYEAQGNFKNILFKLTDGKLIYPISTNLEKTYNTNGKELNKAILKTLILFSIDEEWKEHLRALDDLKQSVQNAHFEQKDPLLIYKFESYELFRQMLIKINQTIVSSIMKIRIFAEAPTERKVMKEVQQQKLDMNRMQTSRSENSTNDEKPQKQQPIKAAPKVGRNDLCPCGSGKKYKNCCGQNLNE